MAKTTEEEKLHGAALVTLIKALSEQKADVFFKLRSGFSRSAYFIEHQSDLKQIGNVESIGLYVKVSRSRRSPWRYTFRKDHQEEILHMAQNCRDVFVLLINNDDGVTCLHYDQLKQILDEHFEEAESVAVKRDLGQAYRVSGRDGRIEQTIPRNSFPGTIIQTFK